MKSPLRESSHRILIGAVVASLAVGPMLLAGCGPSAEEAKETKALERIHGQAKPGFCRLVNLSQNPLEISRKGRPLSGTVNPDSANMMAAVGVGQQPITIKDPSGDKTTQINFTSMEGVTYVVMPDGKTGATIEHEPLQTGAGGNLHVVFLTEAGAPITSGAVVTVSVDGVPTKLEAGKPFISISPASVVAEGGSFTNSARISVDDALGYTALFIKKANGKFETFLMQNGAPSKPAQSGMSKA